MVPDDANDLPVFSWRHKRHSQASGFLSIMTTRGSATRATTSTRVSGKQARPEATPPGRYAPLLFTLSSPRQPQSKQTTNLRRPLTHAHQAMTGNAAFVIGDGSSFGAASNLRRLLWFQKHGDIFPRFSGRNKTRDASFSSIVFRHDTKD